MTQEILNSSEALRHNHDISVKVNDIAEIKPGLLFPDEDTSTEAVLKWGERALCPLMKARRDKGLAETEGERRGRRCLVVLMGEIEKLTES